MRTQGVTAMPSMLYLVKQLELAVRARLDDLVRSAGITALQYTALTVLERHDGLSAAQLARDSFVTAQSMADMVRALESRGLIRRERNAGNRRELLIRLTPAGRALLASVATPVQDLESRLVSKMSPDEAADFRQSLIVAWQALA
ncbi:MarR family winged helix-turn-helix transcriptional regulator [Actinoplanes sp. OR16]|uniref:MarR family winged helix-turn-helix transcriptional regulator n=1 Tax=Actinoplanes sp. OR16 TaxID=946334 RepID=UPI0018D55908|nr:MarR family transcriptional regulator [Actinoplanes sp. OR16]